MGKEVLDEREFELVNIIGAELGSNQRDLSRHMDLSLGMVNMLIRRLIAKGYIRIEQLNKRKVKYILTPKGFSEKMQKSIKYTFKTVVSIGLIKERVKKVITQLYHEEGYRDFTILGKSDFALLINMVFHEMGYNDHTIVYVNEVPAEGNGGVLIICKENANIGDHHFAKTVDLVNELAKDDSFINHIGGAV
jgi:DNA-binding MarR family transcriptional regulator